MIQEAFFKTCNEAQPAERHFVSLYRRISYYGGPEEGGWWGHDNELVASQQYPTQEAAMEAAKNIQDLADKLTKEAKDADCQLMADQCDWLEARGLDADYLPEPDGPCEYFVQVEEIQGEATKNGPRHYE